MIEEKSALFGQYWSQRTNSSNIKDTRGFTSFGHALLLHCLQNTKATLILEGRERLVLHEAFEEDAVSKVTAVEVVSSESSSLETAKSILMKKCVSYSRKAIFDVQNPEIDRIDGDER